MVHTTIIQDEDLEVHCESSEKLPVSPLKLYMNESKRNNAPINQRLHSLYNVVFRARFNINWKKKNLKL